MARLIGIIAYSTNEIIGNGDELPWNCKEDMKHFKKVTSGHAVVMGRKTFESIGRPLPNRLNIVMTKQLPLVDSYKANESVLFVNSKQQVLDIVKQTKTQNVFIIGGKEIYELFDGHYDALYVTKIHARVEGDVQKPNLAKSDLLQWNHIPIGLFNRDKNNEYSGSIYRLEKHKI